MSRWLSIVPLIVLVALAALFIGWSLKRDPAIKLHNAQDHSHPSLLGSYLAAATVYATIYGKSPVGNAYDAYGQIDAEEKSRIFQRLEAMPLSAEEKAFVFDELSSPLDIDAVASRADTPEHASEI